MKNKISNTADAFFKVKLNKQCNKITSAMEFTNKTSVAELQIAYWVYIFLHKIHL